MQSYLTPKKDGITMSLGMKDPAVPHLDHEDSKESILVSMIFSEGALNQFLANSSAVNRKIEHVVLIYW